MVNLVELLCVFLWFNWIPHVSTLDCLTLSFFLSFVVLLTMLLVWIKRVFWNTRCLC